MSRRMSAAVTVVAAIGALAAPGGAAAAPVVDTSDLRDAVTLEGVVEHMQEFQYIADANGGNREASSPGYDASVAYVVEQLEAAGYEVTEQEFDYDYFEEVEAATLTRTRGEGAPEAYEDGVDISTMDFSGSGTLSGVVQAVDVVVPMTPGSPDGTSNSGCEAEDFTGFTGDIALIQRGTCDFSVKIANAVAAGADAVIIFNEGNSEDRSGVDFGQASFAQDVPVVEMSYEAGAALVELIESSSEPITLEGSTNTINEQRSSSNVIADWPGGREDRTVVSGAHLDSVAEGPGINDNGSGSAGLLETALEVAELGVEPRNHLRFIWFGAEESGLVGSQYYVDQLSKRELKDIAVMLNFDMIGSPNPGWFVYDGDASDTASTGSAGSGVVEDVFVDFFDSIGRISEPTAFDGRSDYDAFVAAGIPAGGLFTGAEDHKTVEQAAPDYWGGEAGVAYDPCYHAACDTIENYDPTALDEMSDALAHGLWTFAMTTSAIEGTSKGNATGRYDPSFKGSSAIR